MLPVVMMVINRWITHGALSISKIPITNKYFVPGPILCVPSKLGTSAADRQKLRPSKINGKFQQDRNSCGDVQQTAIIIIMQVRWFSLYMEDYSEYQYPSQFRVDGKIHGSLSVWYLQRIKLPVLQQKGSLPPLACCKRSIHCCSTNPCIGSKSTRNASVQFPGV